jgi:hypothetical protein
MRRNRTVERLLAWKRFFWGSNYEIITNIVPPLSVVRLKRKLDWAAEWQQGDTFRIGYYSPLNGPNEVRVVDADGEYHWAWTQESLLGDFEVVHLSHETDIFGRNRPKIGKL